jgi:UDP-glucose 4-epimerase
MVKEVAGVDFEVREAPRRPGDPASLVAQADAIRRTLGWEPRYNDLRQIVTDAWRWEKNVNIGTLPVFSLKNLNSEVK